MEINPNQPQTQTKVPPPPTPEVSVRTMQSDIKSISQGEVSPTPEIVAPKSGFNNPAQGFMPDAPSQMMSDEETTVKKSRKGLWTIIILVIVLGLAAVGYFIIAPMMSAPLAEPITETQQPVVAPQPVVAAHLSAFGNAIPGVPSATLSLPVLSRETIIQGLTDQGALATEGLTEIIFQDATGGQLPFPALVATLLPEFLDGQSAGSYLADDFTAYIYKDKNGVWPGYIASLRSEGATTLGQWLVNFEKANLSALFVTTAGTLGAFKDGSVKGITDRFAAGTAAGASLSYAMTATDLHIATSFEGLKATLTALGY